MLRLSPMRLSVSNRTPMTLAVRAPPPPNRSGMPHMFALAQRWGRSCYLYSAFVPMVFNYASLSPVLNYAKLNGIPCPPGMPSYLNDANSTQICFASIHSGHSYRLFRFWWYGTGYLNLTNCGGVVAFKVSSFNSDLSQLSTLAPRSVLASILHTRNSNDCQTWV